MRPTSVATRGAGPELSPASALGAPGDRARLAAQCLALAAGVGRRGERERALRPALRDRAGNVELVGRSVAGALIGARALEAVVAPDLRVEDVRVRATGAPVVAVDDVVDPHPLHVLGVARQAERYRVAVIGLAGIPGAPGERRDGNKRHNDKDR